MSLSDLYKKQIKDRIAWVKAERAAGREPAPPPRKKDKGVL